MMSLGLTHPLLLTFVLLAVESAQCCRVSAGVREERGGAVSYSNSECLMGSRLWNQIFPASCVSGASGTEWSVKYNQQEICALEGSTVFMNGSYTHPEDLTVTETFWVIDPDQGKELTDLSKDPGYSGRVEYLTDRQKHFSIRLRDVTKMDEHQYGFRIITSANRQRWMGYPGVQLRVTDLSVEAPGEVTEGGTAVLTCNTTCSLTDPTFIWYKNGRPLTTKTIKNNQLHLQPVSSEDAGSYSCAVEGYQHLPSTNQTLRVGYPPKSVSVSISGHTVEGSSVILTCSSDGNPPVKNYTWFREGGASPVGSGHSYSIASITAEHSGLYYCVAQNEHGAQNGSVEVTVESQHLLVSYLVWAAVGVGGGCIILLVVLSWICGYRLKTRAASEGVEQNEVLYATITPAKGAEAAADVQDQVSSIGLQGEPIYDNVTVHYHHHDASATGPPTEAEEERSVIYSIVKTT